MTVPPSENESGRHDSGRRAAPRSWLARRQIAAPPQLTADASPREQRSWQGRSPSLASRGWPLLAKRVLLATAAAVLIVLLIRELLSVRRFVPIVACFTGTYRLPYPPIPLIVEDRALLATLAKPGSWFFQPAPAHVTDVSTQAATASADELVELLTTALRRVRPGGPENNVVIVHLTAIGAVDASGRACIVPPGSGLDPASLGEDALLGIDRLLGSLRDAVPDTARLIVILDGCRASPVWPLGVDDGGFSAAVDAFMASTTLKRTWVFLPAASGQHAHSSAAGGCSGWMREFVGAMHGAADGRPYGDRDGRVELREVAACVTERVDRWASETVGDRQTPVLLGSADDRDANPQLTWAPIGQPVFPRPRSVEATDRDWLSRRWRTAEQLRSTGIRDRPLLWSHYLHLLMRAETLFSAGAGYRDEQIEVVRTAERIESRLSVPLITDIKLLPASRLSQAGVTTTMPPEIRDWVSAVEAYVSPSAKAADAGKPSDTAAKTSGTPSAAKPPATPPAPAKGIDAWQARAEAGWAWLTERCEAGETFDRDAIARWLECVLPRTAGPTYDPSQIHALRMLVHWVDPSDWQTAPALLRDLILLMKASRQAIYGGDVRADATVFADVTMPATYASMRRAFDLAFIGGEAGLAEAATDARNALAGFEALLDRSRRLSRIMQLVDSVRADAPYLAAWWTEEHRHAVRVPGDRDSAALGVEGDVWATLISSIDQIESFNIASAGQAVPVTEDVLRDIEKIRDRCLQAFETIRRAHDADCGDLTAHAPDSPQTLGAIRRILALPLVQGDARIRLLQRADELDHRHADRENWESKPNAAGLAPPDPLAATAGWIVWRDLLVHPLPPLLGVESAGTTAPPTTTTDMALAIGQQAAATRNVVRSLPAIVARFDRERETLEVNASDDTPRTLELLGRASFATQRIAAAAGQRPQLVGNSTPTQRFMAAAWHSRLMRHASFTLDDFWNGVEEGDPVYCQEKARTIVDVAADVVRTNGVTFGDATRDRILARIATLASHGASVADVTATPSRLLLPTGRDDVAPVNVLRAVPRKGVPSGLAAAWLSESIAGKPLPVIRDRAGDSGPPRSRLAVPMWGEPRDASWTVDPSGARYLERTRSPVVDLTCWFRGHRLVIGLPVASAAAMRTTTWTASPASPPRVTVRGEAARSQAVSVVFDCSGSMGQRLADGRTRLDAGRAAVLDVLGQLGKSGRWEVSLWLYGHRTRWSRDKSGKYSAGLTPLGQAAKAAAGRDGKPFTLLPGDDVEQVMPMQELTGAVAARIADLLAPLEPGGETPLYLAISEAVGQDFAGARVATPAHVVVVTDGGNDQTGGRYVTAASVEDQVARLNGRRTAPLHVDVIGFALGESDWQRTSRIDDIRNLATSTGGRFYEASNATTLSRALRESMRLLRWRVVGPGAPRDSQELGASLGLPTPSVPTTVPYEAVLESGAVAPRQSFAVQAGDSIDLYATGGGRGLEFRRYDGGTEQGIRDSRSPILDPLDPSRRLFVAAHLATRSGDEVRFPLSIQNADASRFSPRPVECWVEIVPVDADGSSGQPFVFYDPVFETDRTVPVLKLVAPNWPRTAARADVRGWFRFTPVPADVQVDLRTVATGASRSITLPGMPDAKVTMSIEPATPEGITTIRVLEEHPAEMANRLPCLRVSVTAGVGRAVHVVEPSTGRVRHEFTIRGDAGGLPTDARLEITDRQRILSGACAITADGAPPLTLPVPAP